MQETMFKMAGSMDSIDKNLIRAVSVETNVITLVEQQKVSTSRHSKHDADKKEIWKRIEDTDKQI